MRLAEQVNERLPHSILNAPIRSCHAFFILPLKLDSLAIPSYLQGKCSLNCSRLLRQLSESFSLFPIEQAKPMLELMSVFAS